MNTVSELILTNLAPNYNATIQLLRRDNGATASGVIHGSNTNFAYHFDVTGIALGDYLCQLSGFTNPDGEPFPVRITADGVFCAKHWREMDVLFPIAHTDITSPIVFISYSHSDHAVADAIVDTLDNLGIATFRDIKNIEWGHALSSSVQNGLQSASAIIVILSPGSIKSQWVAYEVGFGIGTKKRIFPFLTHPNLDRPGFIGDLIYVKSVAEVHNYFSKNKNWHEST